MEPTAPGTPGYPRMTMDYVNEKPTKEPVEAVKKWWPGLLLLIPAFFLWMWATNPMVVVVDGIGEVEVPATSALLTYSVLGQGADPTSAINDANNKIISTQVVLQNVEQGDISQSQVQVAPSAAGGYQAVISVGAKTADVSALQDFISRLYAAGAIVVSQPILSVNAPETYEDQAFNLALKDAKKKAGEMGNKNWRFIRRMTGISQTGASSTSTSTKGADYDTELSNPETINSAVFKVSQAVTVSYKMW